MKIIVCGAGQVGFGIAERLAAEDNDVSVIDQTPELVERISNTLDVRGFVGHGAHPEVLEQAGARDADMIVAVTLYDEVNMLACHVAHTLFDVPTKVARVRAQTYLDERNRALFSRDRLPIDVIISPEVEVGETIIRRLSLPGAFETITFGDGQVTVAGVVCEEDCPILDTQLKQLSDLFPDLPALIVAIVRKGKLFVPRAEDQLVAGDEAYFVARADQVGRTLKIFGHDRKMARRAIIAGGGNIGLYVARRLEQTEGSTRAKIIEVNRRRAVDIAGQLRRTMVLHGSALDEEILLEADIENTDMLVALTNDDQVNILSSVLAKRLGAARNLCLVNNSGYMTILRSLGIDGYLNPRVVTVSRVLQLVRRGRIRGVHAIQDGAAEFIEADALETSTLVGKPIGQLGLPDGIKISAILRKGEYVRPGGDVTIQPKDRVVILAMAEHVRLVEQMFRVAVAYF